MNLTDKEELSQESKVHLYSQLAGIIRKQIETGELKPGQKISTFQELMEKYNVSLSTVKLAMSNLVSEGLLYSRQGRGTFVSTKLPQVQKTGLIGLLLTDIRNPFYSNIAHAIQNYARDFNYGILHSYSNNQVPMESEAINLFIEKRVDGIIAIFVSPIMIDAYEVALAIAGAADGKKPVLSVFMGKQRSDEGVAWLRQKRVPVYRFPENAAAAMAGAR